MRTIALALMLSLSGCAALSAGPTSSSSVVTTVTVSSPPPANKAPEAIPSCPGGGYIWVAGYWDYLDGNYIWRDGRWLQVKSDYDYVRARYEFDGTAWVFHRPHWKRRHYVSTAPLRTASSN